MKSNVKSNIIIIGILFTLLPIITTSLSYITNNSNRSLEYSNEFAVYKDNLKISDDPDPNSGKIHINNNWTAAKVAGICTGKGTSSEPYVIKNLVIDGNRGNCILIENSDVYFIIKECTVFNSIDTGYTAGLALLNVSNSRLTSNNCNNNRNGILVTGSNNTISGNTAYYNVHGINLLWGEYNNITGNTAIYNDDRGISVGVGGGSNNIISRNTVNYNEGYGIYISGLYNTISGNTVNNNSVSGVGMMGWLAAGIGLRHANDNNISGNTVNNNYCGFELSYSNNNTILGNSLAGNDVCIVEYYCQGNKFSDNGSCRYGISEDGMQGYNLFLLLGILSVVSIILSKKLKKS